MFDSYEYTRPMYINKHQFYERHGWCTTDEDVQRWRQQEMEDGMSKQKWTKNLEWITEHLRFVDHIRYEDLNVGVVPGKAPYFKLYKGVVYDMRDPKQAVMLYGALTGKPQKIFDVDEYVAERRKQNGKRTDMGTDRTSTERETVGNT